MPYQYYGYGFDSTYLWCILPAVLISLWAQWRVNSAFKKYESVFSRRGLTGAQIAEKILSMNGLSNLRVERVAGRLSDHYDPRKNALFLSESVYGSPSVGAIGVAAHEAGHALQNAEGYAPFRARGALVPVVNVGSMAAGPLILLGMFAGLPFLMDAGIVAFSAIVLFQIVTLPVEYDASRRALAALENKALLDAGELNGAKKVLNAAALTYVAAALASALQLLRLIFLSNNRRGRR
jgi:Zn-dependent membrane protease YugP